MKYCQKCGKELFDEAVICPGCGCPTTNMQSSNPIFSDDYPKIREFSENVNSAYIFSLIGTILCLGIGILFAIVAWIKLKSLSVPKISSTKPNEIAEFESAKRKLQACLTLAIIPAIVLFGLAMIVLCVALWNMNSVGIGLIFAIATWLIWFWGASCIKHLNACSTSRASSKTLPKQNTPDNQKVCWACNTVQSAKNHICVNCGEIL